MTTVSPIWKLMIRAGVLDQRQAKQWYEQFQNISADVQANDSTPRAEPTPGEVLQWLAEQGGLSPFQAELLQAGIAGPFRFGDYVIREPVADGPLQGTFLARHAANGHSARLWFFTGDSETDIADWARASRLVDRWGPVNDECLWQILARVDTGDYRAVATTSGEDGQPFAKHYREKSRLEWPAALSVLRQLLKGLQALHDAGLAHHDVRPDSLWVQSGGGCQILPPIRPPRSSGKPSRYASPTRQSATIDVDPIDAGPDLFSAAQVAVRLITGSVPRFHALAADDRNSEIDQLFGVLKRFELPDLATELLRGLLLADVAENPVSAKGSLALLNRIDAIPDSEPIPAARVVANTPDDSDAEDDEFEFAKKPTVEKPDFGLLENVASASTGTLSSRERIARRRSRRQSGLGRTLIFAAAILVLAVGTGLAVTAFSPRSDSSVADNTTEPSDRRTASPNDDTSGSAGGETVPAATEASDTAGPAEPTDGESAGVASSPWLEQILVNEGDLPWESPTAGAPLDLALLPAAPEFVFAWRPAQMLSGEQSARSLQALGPAYAELQTWWEDVLQVPLTECESVLVSLHPRGGEYQWFVAVRLVQPVAESTAREWYSGSSMAETQVADSIRFANVGNGELALQLAPDVEDDEGAVEETGDTTADANAKVERMVTGFVWGTGSTLDESHAGSDGVNVDRYVSSLVARSDARRDVTVIFLNSALTSEEGMKLFAGVLSPLRRPLELFFDRRVRAVMVSVHHGGGAYLELMAEHTADLQPSELETDFANRLRNAARDLESHVTALPDHPYWQGLRDRFAPMIESVIAGSRIGYERDGFIANCWLPPTAIHNLVAAAELTLSAERFAVAAPSQPTGPRDISALLQTRRDLVVTNSPDLRILLEELQNEVRGDFPDLPFTFSIRLQGDDLQLEGITQNQRPGAIDLRNQSLADILTEILFKANPDKDAESPADPRCKLLWVVGDDPDDPSNPAVLITTRSAAQTKGYKLPEAFVMDPDSEK